MAHTLKVYGKTGHTGWDDTPSEQKDELIQQLKGMTAYTECELKEFNTKDLLKLHKAVKEKAEKNKGAYYGIMPGFSVNAGQGKHSRAKQTMLGMDEQHSDGLKTYGGNLSTNEAAELQKLKEWDYAAVPTPAHVLQRKRDLERKAKGGQKQSQPTTGGSPKEPSRAMRTMFNLQNR